jgi:antitoxin (DNA-binding transcriptional repressor) of toxin-antitoxin stability system
MTVTLEEAQKSLPELIAGLKPGDEIVITQNAQPVAQVVPVPQRAAQPRQPGSAKGILTIVAEDDEHLEDFREYMP